MSPMPSSPARSRGWSTASSTGWRASCAPAISTTIPDQMAVVDSRLDEFARIARFFAPLAGAGALGLLDDAALVDAPPGRQLVVTADALVAGVHFLADDPPDLVARKMLRVNLSDLAAMGAAPLGFLMTTALPAACDEASPAGFSYWVSAHQAMVGVSPPGGGSVARAGPPTGSGSALGRAAAR